MSLPTKNPSPPEHFYRTNKRGLLEAVETSTGRVLAVQSSVYDYLEDKFERLVRIDTPEGPVYLEKGLSFDVTNRMQGLAYSRALADLICEQIVQGRTLVEACAEYNVEYSWVCRWRREQVEFKEALELARKDRAEAFHDEAITEARTSADKKLRVETLKWGAEKGDADRFANKTTVRGDKDAPLGFIIDTGIRRQGDAGFVDPENAIPDEKKGDIELVKNGDSYDME